MKRLFNEIVEELNAVISGKTLDALIPPLIFVSTNNYYCLFFASIAAVVSAIMIGIIRFLLKEKWHYALGGLFGVIIAATYAYIAGNAENYFLPGLLLNAIFLIATIVSLIIGKPIAALASHLLRGWELKWFWRNDIKPAYREVTVFWLIFLFLRLAFQVSIFIEGDIIKLFWARTLLGVPTNTLVLIISYIYGVWRLKNLKGPGIHEFREGKEPPWEGQVRGF